MREVAYVYILASGFKHLYIGVTSELEQRVSDHKKGKFPGSFTERYNIHHLVYYERFGDIGTAIAREKQLKRWSRIKKIRLIVATNPDWKDLSEEWEKPTKSFSGELRPPTTF
jgi:putative endonuclease